MGDFSGWFGVMWLSVAVLPLLISLAMQRANTFLLLRDLRIPRILYYWMLAWVGWALAHGPLSRMSEMGPLVSKGGLPMLALFINLAYAAVFAIVTNDQEDLEIDRISNPDRPLVSNRIDARFFKRAGLFCLVLAVVLSAMGGWAFVLGVFGISLGYFVYSSRPFKLKRFPVVAKLVLGLNSWLAALSGFMIAGGQPAAFPWIWTLFILVPLGLSANFVDLKDVVGDKVAGIRTLPVLLGEKMATHLIAIATIVAYAMGNILIGYPWSWLLAIPACAVHIFWLYRRPYRETPVFVSLLTTLAGLVFFLIFKEMLPK